MMAVIVTELSQFMGGHGWRIINDLHMDIASIETDPQ